MMFANIVDKITNTYQREVEQQPKKYAGFYATLTLIIFLIFGLIGARPALTKLIQSIKYNMELRNARSALAQKLGDIDAQKKELKSVEDRLMTLYELMPYDDDLETYLTMFVVAANNSGYTVDRLYKTEETGTEENTIKIFATLEGSLDNINLLTREIENIDRITYIDKIDTLVDRQENQINVRLSIFSVPKGVN